MIVHILDLIEVVVESGRKLTTLDLGFEIYDLNSCFPRVVPCHTGGSMTSLTIDRNLLLLVVAKKTMAAYMRLFSGVLNKPSITSLSIRMLGKLPTLVGALGAAMRGRKKRNYSSLAIWLGRDFTHESGCSPYWEAIMGSQQRSRGFHHFSPSGVLG